MFRRGYITRENSGEQLLLENSCYCSALVAWFDLVSQDVVFTGCLDATVQVWRLFPVGGGRQRRRDTATDATDCSRTSGQLNYEACVVEYLKVTELVTAISISPKYVCWVPTAPEFCRTSVTGDGLKKTQVYGSESKRNCIIPVAGKICGDTLQCSSQHLSAKLPWSS